MDYDALKQEVTQHGNYLTAEDHVITKGMKMREPWKKQATQISKEFSNLRALINIYDVTCNDIDMSTLEDKLSKLRNLIDTIKDPPTPDTNMSSLSNLKRRLRGIIHTKEALLATMRTAF